MNHVDLSISTKHYAHTLEGQPVLNWEPLETHLNEVADRTERFAESFGGGPIGRLLGLWHDLGKYLAAFTRGWRIIRAMVNRP
jgi:CRISPR-associated endonuclease/helicase Cas3